MFNIEPTAPMVLIPYSSFVSFGAIPRSSDRDSLKVTCYNELIDRDKREGSLIAFISHRWLNPTLNPKDMHPDRDNIKYRTIVEGFNRLLSGLHIDVRDVYLWIDFCCIDQDDPSVLGAGVRRYSMIHHTDHQ